MKCFGSSLITLWKPLYLRVAFSLGNRDCSAGKEGGPEAGDLLATTACSKSGFANAFFNRALMHNARV